MPLVKAIVAGGIAAVAIPYFTMGGTSQLSEWAGYGVVHFSIGGVQLGWSWPLFCLITLFTWGLLGWANR